MIDIGVSYAECVRYKGIPEEEALKDLTARSEEARESYVTLSSVDYCWARLYNMGAPYSVLSMALMPTQGSRLESNNVRSYLQSRIMFYLMSFHANSRPIYVCTSCSVRLSH